MKYQELTHVETEMKAPELQAVQWTPMRSLRPLWKSDGVRSRQEPERGLQKHPYLAETASWRTEAETEMRSWAERSQSVSAFRDNCFFTAILSQQLEVLREMETHQYCYAI